MIRVRKIDPLYPLEYQPMFDETTKFTIELINGGKKEKYSRDILLN